MSEKEKNRENNQNKFDLQKVLLIMQLELLMFLNNYLKQKQVNIFLIKSREAVHRLLQITEMLRMLKQSELNGYWIFRF